MTVNNDYFPRQSFCSKLSQVLRPSNLFKIFTAALALSSGASGVQASPITQNVNDLTIYSPLAPDTGSLQSACPQSITNFLSDGYSLGLFLMNAANDGNKACTIELLAKASDVPSFHRGRALQIAIEKGHKDIAIEILTKGLDIEYYQLGQALEYASRKDYREVVAAILAKEPTSSTGYMHVASAHDRYMGTALNYASAKGHKEIVIELLDKMINVPAEDFRLALNYAKLKGHPDIENVIQKFIAEGEGFKLKIETLCERAATEKNHELGEVFVEASKRGYRDGVTKILANTSDIEKHYLVRALEHASEKGFRKIIMELLTHVPAEDFHTAIQNAKRNGHQGIVNVIQEFLKGEDEKFKRETLRECAALGAVGALYYLVKKCKKRPVPNLGAGSLIVASNKGESCGICLKDFFKCEPRFSHEGGNHDGFHSRCLREWVKMNPTCPYDQQAINPNSPKLLMERVMKGTVNAVYAASLGALGGVAATEAGGTIVEIPAITGVGVIAVAGVAKGLGIREILNRRQFDTARKNIVLGMFLGEVTALIGRSVLDLTLVTTCATSALVGGVAAGMLSLTDLFDD